MTNTGNATFAPFRNRAFETLGSKTWYQVGLIALIIASTILNTLVLAHYFYSRRHIGRNLLIKKCLVASLAISDMLQSTLGYSLQLSFIMYQLDLKICQYSAFGVTLCAFASINHIVLLSIDSYVHICHPWLKQRINLSRNTVEVVFIIMAWIYAFFWAAYPLFRWNDYSLFLMNACTINWHTNDRTHKKFILGIFFMCILVPITVMTICNVSCQRTLRKMRKYAEQHFGPNAEATIENARAETKVLKLGLIMGAAFLVSWTPYSLLGLMHYFSIQFSSKHLIMFGGFSSFAAKTSCILNPIIHTLTQKTFRDDVFGYLKVCCIFCCIGCSHYCYTSNRNAQYYIEEQQPRFETHL